MTARSDSNQRRERTRTAEHAARSGKGHPRREARRQRAAERATNHSFNADRCGPNCAAV